MTDITGTGDLPPTRFVAAGPNGAFIASGEIIVEPAAAALLGEIAGAQGVRLGDPEEIRIGQKEWLHFRGLRDVMDAVDQLAEDGLFAQPNHGFSFHGADGGTSESCCCNPCGPHPSQLGANPFMSHPFMSHPFMSHPFMSHPFMSHGEPRNTATPTFEPAWVPTGSTLSWANTPKVTVLDTGLAGTPNRPPLLTGTSITGVDDPYDESYPNLDGTMVPEDKILDPVAGHGTFIAGVIEQLAPGATIDVRDVATGAGVIDELTLANAMLAAIEAGTTILSMSVGGPLLTSDVLPSAVTAVTAAGVVMVASAGNSGTCEPFYPAAFTEVVAVGALGTGGPATFTNYGNWVDASAPATDRTSAYYRNLPSDVKSPTPGVDPANFDGWAVWSGTSFAVPVVVAALLREMALFDLSAADAVAKVIRAPHLLRVPGLGVVVNL